MTRFFLQCAVALAVVSLVSGEKAWARPLKVGHVRPYRAETPHPYPLGTQARPVVWTDTVVSPGAEFVRVHFRNLNLAPGDFLTVSSRDGAQIWTYTGRGQHKNGDVWAFAIDGDTAIVRIHGGRGMGQGYLIDAVGHGTLDLSDRKGAVPEVLCGSEGREDVACHTGNGTFNAAQRPVARLLFTSGGSQFLCTGELIAGSMSSTLITNNHCIDTQTETASLQATFNFQRTACGGSTNAAPTVYAGGRLLKTSSEKRKGHKGGLDYTLLTLLGNPEASWGELTATTKSVSVGSPIWLVQHGGGLEKTVGWFEDAGHAVLCRVDTINATYGFSAAGSQTGYACDSEGGSSGSAFTEPASGRAIALHHYGGVSGNLCLNSGTSFARICADAGSLLRCVAD